MHQERKDQHEPTLGILAQMGHTQGRRAVQHSTALQLTDKCFPPNYTPSLGRRHTDVPTVESEYSSEFRASCDAICSAEIMTAFGSESQDASVQCGVTRESGETVDGVE